MNALKAREIIDRTLYEDETVLAFSAVTDVDTQAPTLVDSSPNFWIAVTQSRFITVGEASGKATSYRLPEIKILEVRRKLLGGNLLHFDPAGYGPGLGLSTFKIHDKVAAKALPSLIASRSQAPTLRQETTSYTSVTVKSPPHLASLIGEESVEFRCITCDGACGGILKGEETIYPECSGCQRAVTKPSTSEC
ncbi:hypothetical protein ACFWWB_35865 [Streptomyces sp. NPDC058690]|uniref:hypothetical protein n=1 Tax=Streptomyces sp. NPDC058690 TaxID=3346600 RepID=UPI003658C6A5